MNQSSAKNIKINILSIDGDGIKGVFAAKFLADLNETCLKNEENSFMNILI